MNELLEFAVSCKKMVEDNSSDEQTKNRYRQMLLDTKLYLDGLALLRQETTNKVDNTIKELHSPNVNEPPAVNEPPIVNKPPKVGFSLIIIVA